MPSFIYRLSLKATSLIYIPFLWIIQGHLGENISVRSAIRDRLEGAFERLSWWYALGVIVITLLTVILQELLPAATLGWLVDKSGPVTRVLMDIFVPTNWEKVTFKGWHIARAANAGIYLWLFYYTDKARRRLEDSDWTESKVMQTFLNCKRVQVFLSMYTMACALSRVIKFAIWATLPPVRFQIWP